jgi:hypothetical protein
VLAREAARRRAAWRILERLDLLRRWARYDMWLLERGTPGGLDTTTRLGRLLTDDRRAVVLAIKEAAAAQGWRIPGFAVCQAVVSGEVGSLEEFDRRAAGREGASGQLPQA